MKLYDPDELLSFLYNCKITADDLLLEKILGEYLTENGIEVYMDGGLVTVKKGVSTQFCFDCLCLPGIIRVFYIDKVNWSRSGFVDEEFSIYDPEELERMIKFIKDYPRS